MKRKIDLVKAMRTFVVVAETLSFSEAARRLNIVVSAVSRQVSDLEKHFDCVLLYRTTRAMSLSPEGHFYLDKFYPVLEQLDALEASVEQRHQDISGRLRITAPYHIDKLGVQKKIAQFLVQHPKVQLYWISINHYVNLVEEGFDLAFRVGELADSHFIAKKYGEVQVVFIASPDYLTQNGVPTHPKQLVDHRSLVDSSVRQPGRFRYYESGSVRQVNIDAAYEANEISLLVEFAVQGLGIAQLPLFLVQNEIENGQLVTLLDDFSLPSLDISLVYPASKLNNPTLRAFIEHLVG
ncbi:TPA: LysR family transcriptional regulator [Vibrio vulnificus]|nr:LysR family transcriptional regulator [Vibrio vulnificus]EHH0746690.1 LysR family transcriptional regulator [Vibrio vulnificus]HAS6198518.1 LysR family transcriptional regulator [Vibrio vulnificus]HAS6216223.1 LysR family transcriptional regulator [Vibrio vulnificus]HAT7740556.1 LysR family transcriptional regulator [Vibrio vulnificus]